MIDDSKQKYKAEFKELRFKIKSDFDAWLKKTAVYHVHLEDQGQDLLGLWLDAGGEVIYTDIPQMGKVFNGSLIDLFQLAVGEPPEIMLVEQQANTPLRYPATEIEVLKS